MQGRGGRGGGAGGGGAEGWRKVRFQVVAHGVPTQAKKGPACGFRGEDLEGGGITSGIPLRSLYSCTITTPKNPILIIKALQPFP